MVMAFTHGESGMDSEGVLDLNLSEIQSPSPEPDSPSTYLRNLFMFFNRFLFMYEVFLVFRSFLSERNSF